MINRFVLCKPTRDIPSLSLLQRAARSIFKKENINPKGDLNIIFVDEKFIVKLNREFFKKNRPTDVIAFPYDKNCRFRRDNGFPTVLRKGPVPSKLLGRHQHNKDDRNGTVDYSDYRNETKAFGDAGDFGDVYVCVSVGLKNARFYQEIPRVELTRLAVHGMLHIVGYRDDKPLVKKSMWRRQEEIVKSIFALKK